MCTDVLMNDYVGRGKETFTYMYKECKHYTLQHESCGWLPVVGGGVSTLIYLIIILSSLSLVCVCGYCRAAIFAFSLLYLPG